MRLTPPIPLDPLNARTDAYDLANGVIDHLKTSQLASLRWGKVSDADMISYLTSVYSLQISNEADIPRISAAQEDGKGNVAERREHLVIRDLDLLPYLVEQNPDEFEDKPEASKLGRIVAHADYRFRPKGWHWRDAKHPDLQANSMPVSAGSIPQPSGANVELIKLFNTKVEDLMDHHAVAQDCYELVNIATSASHLRKGLAKQLVLWLFPFCDQQQSDYKLIASPAGKGLYMRCGFVEDGVGDKRAVEMNMGEWGGEGIHQHIYMVRHPEKRSS